LPNATIVSIGHRSTLLLLHDERVDMAAQEIGAFSPRHVAQAAAN
jgi:ABC-type uncharacterized transport system fused permease/ATPase subunit